MIPDKEDKKIIIHKEYILTQKQIKAYFHIEGDIDAIYLSEGLSLSDKVKGYKKDSEKWTISVTETKEIG
jgi:hypothetical protein